LTFWLLDTNVISELRKPQPNRRVVEFITLQSRDNLFVSAVTLAEIRFGIEKLANSESGNHLRYWLKNTVRPMFDERILPVSEDIMLKWRILMDEGRKSGHTYTQPDLFIAATALFHGITLVSRDVRDFSRTGVSLFNPWAAELPR
jgi:predicted nucleic acid-binding protein